MSNQQERKSSQQRDGFLYLSLFSARHTQYPTTPVIGCVVLYSFGLRASSYEPGNRAGPVGGTNFVFCSYGKFNLGYRDEKCPKGHQNNRGTAFRPVSDVTSHAQLKMFRPGIRAGVFIWEKFEKFPARLPRSRSQKPRSR